MNKLLVLGLSLVLMSCATLGGSGSGGSNQSKKNYTTLDEISDLDKINYQLGVDYINSNRYDVAEAKLMLLVQSQPNYPDVYNALGVLQERRGKISDAIALFSKAISLNPYYGTAVNNYSRLQCRSNGAPALASTAQGLTGTLSAGMYSGAAECAMTQKDYTSALAYANNSIGVDSNYSLGHYFKAQALTQLGQHQEALTSLEKYHDIEGYTLKGVRLGLEISKKSHNQMEIDKYQNVLDTQF